MFLDIGNDDNSVSGYKFKRETHADIYKAGKVLSILHRSEVEIHGSFHEFCGEVELINNAKLYLKGDQFSFKSIRNKVELSVLSISAHSGFEVHIESSDHEFASLLINQLLIFQAKVINFQQRF